MTQLRSFFGHGKAEVNPDRPVAFATCDRCGVLTNRDQLASEFEWFGSHLQSKRNRICDRCFNDPAPFLRARALPVDGLPIRNPRPGNFADDATTYISTETLIPIDNENGDIWVTEP